MKLRKNKMVELRHMEYYQFINEVFMSLKPFDLEALQIIDEVKKLQDKFSKFDECLKKENAFNSPEGMQKVDEDRDFFLRNLYSIASAFSTYPEKGKSIAANGLLKTMDMYGDNEIAAMPQNDESASITNLIQDLNREPAKKYLEILDIVLLKDMLGKANNDFIALKHDKTGNEALLIRGETKLSRGEVEKMFIVLSDKINALVIINGEKKYSEIIRRINHLIDKYLSAVEQRRKPIIK